MIDIKSEGGSIGMIYSFFCPGKIAKPHCGITKYVYNYVSRSIPKRSNRDIFYICKSVCIGKLILLSFPNCFHILKNTLLRALQRGIHPDHHDPMVRNKILYVVFSICRFVHLKK